MFFKRIFFLTILSVLYAVLCKDFCNLNDEVCVTKAANYHFKSIVAGIPLYGLESSEPLNVKTINANLSHHMNYTFTDVYMYGMKNCTIQKLKFINDSSWYFYLICPQLIFEADFIEKGVVDCIPIESNGKVVFTYDNYHIGSQGECETITGFDGKPHMNITNFKIDLLDAKEKVYYKFTNLFSTNKEKSEKAHRYLNDNWKRLSGEIEYPIMNLFMGILLNNINKFHAAVPKFEIFYNNR